MPRKLAVQTLRVVEGRDFTAPRDIDPRDIDPRAIDYDADYRALDLAPGAPLREIEDRARLLYAAFHPDRLPGPLKARAAARSEIINRAADELSRYWKTHGAAPPASRAHRRGARSEHPGQAGDGLGPAEGLLAALADALGAGVAEATDDAPADCPTSPSRVVHDLRGDRPPAQFGRLPAARPAQRIAGARERLPPGARGRVDQPQRMTGANQLPTGEAALPVATVRVAAQPREAPDPGNAGRSDPRHRRPWLIARSVLVKAAIVGLVIAAAIRLQQYRSDHPAPGAAAEPYSATATGLPGDPPARWSGLSGHQPTGAAAPAIAGHHRQN